MSDDAGSEAENEASRGSDEEQSPTSESPPEESGSESEKEVSYMTYQLFVFLSCFVGHSLFVYNRKVFQYVLPHIINEGILSGYQITMIMILQQTGYAVSSFFMGLALDKQSPKALFAVGMFLSGFFNFGFSDVDEATNLMLLAAMNGISNGFGWPCIVKMMRMWFPTATFGLWWAMFNMSFFFVHLTGPGVASRWAADHGWRVAIQMPAVISMMVAVALYFTNFDKPSDVGYEDQEFKGEESNAHWSDMLGCPFMLVLCGGGFLMSLIRLSAADWGQLYLMEERGISVYSAGRFTYALEFGGAFGTIVIGAMADFAIRMKMHIGYYKFPRMILMFASLCGGAASLSCFILGIDAYSGSIAVNSYGFLMGLTFCAALQNLEAMVIETAPTNRFSACYAIFNFSVQVAGVMAGFPMSFLASAYGWSRAFMFLNFAVLFVFFALTIGKDLDQTFLTKAAGKKKQR